MVQALLLLTLLAAGGEPTSSPPVPSKTLPRANRFPINAEQALKIAERFVRENGYTDFVPKDTAKLRPESFTITEREEWLALRKKTLLPKARGAMKGAMYAAKGWTVGFALAKPLSDPDIGLAVTMDEFGEDLKMQHQGFMLKSLETDAR